MVGLSNGTITCEFVHSVTHIEDLWQYGSNSIIAVGRPYHKGSQEQYEPNTQHLLPHKNRDIMCQWDLQCATVIEDLSYESGYNFLYICIPSQVNKFIPTFHLMIAEYIELVVQKHGIKLLFLFQKINSANLKSAPSTVCFFLLSSV